MRKVLSRLRSAIIALGTAWAIVGSTLVALALMEGTLRLIFWAKDVRNVQTLPDRRVLEQGYGNESWPIDHFRELSRLEDRWEPFVYFRQKPFAGETIHVDDQGRRATWTAPARPAPGRKPITILFLGGSSLWGFGARDDQTIPSYVAKELDRPGLPVTIRNLAEIGYVSTQEVIALIRDLQAGERPDYVVFYDGVNDTTSALLDGTAGVSTNESNRRREFNILHDPKRLMGGFLGHYLTDSASLRFAQAVRRRLGSDAISAHPSPNMDERDKLAADVVRRYEANIDLVKNLGKSYGFRPLFFWQPTVFDKSKLAPFEAEENEKMAWTGPMFGSVYAKIRESGVLHNDPSFHDLSGIFADKPDLVFIDYCHTTESANAVLGSVITNALVKAIEAGPSGLKRFVVDASSKSQACGDNVALDVVGP